MRSSIPLVLVVVMGCGGDPEAAARAAVEAQGYADVSLERSGEVFSFTATRDGQACRGSVGVSEGLFEATASAVVADCTPPSEAERCRTGEAAACVPAGVAAREQDPAAAAELWAHGCGLGDAQSCHNAGIAYAGMEGVPPNPARALQLYQQGCDRGLAVSCHNAARVSFPGGAGAPDAAAKRRLLERACEGDHAPACVDLALDIHEEDGPRAVQLLQAACEAGELLGCKNHGAMYLNGQAGLPRDQARGVELIGRACAGGEASSCRVLGGIAGHANTRAETRAAAVEQLRAACAAGRQPACDAAPPE